MQLSAYSTYRSAVGLPRAATKRTGGQLLLMDGKLHAVEAKLDHDEHFGKGALPKLPKPPRWGETW